MKKQAIYGFLSALGVFFLVVLIGLGDALKPLIVAWALSYFCIPMFHFGQQHGIPKAVLAFAILLLILCAFMAFLFVFVPYLISELQFFIADFPQFVVGFIKHVTTELAAHDIHVEIDDFSLMSFVRAHLPKVSAKSLVWVGSAFQSALSNIIYTILSLISLFIFPVFFFYVSISYDTINNTIQTWVPPRYWKQCTALEEAVDEVLGGFLRGQLMIASTLAIYYSISLTAIDVKFGMIIGLCTGFLSLIPYVGFSIGLFAALIVATASGAGIAMIIAIVIIFFVAYLVDNFVMTPWLVGERVGLNSLSVMLALIIGGNLLGLWGMLLAIPAAALVKRGFSAHKQAFQQSRWYSKQA